ncbi:hypothetical protein [Cardinium endosymbiont of Dermatophagoides farinae]|uniref:hypothetical protein n=1 Tax=Cardinium endosymbiont of Dermatophagoides farinae TaxID=2597823 RepID=UPI0011829ED9|nr:hypothetical protein [Cardinium endosymbiont of Dermatophagoides farinae]TSJ80735.1 hypothetical protein FPG78_01510 [Cardinium endosymbiont of Dermatophagoides farinae]
MIPTDWYRWDGTKLDVDYLLIDEKLLHDVTIIFKVLHVKTLVVYTKQTQPFYYNPKIKKLGIPIIWLKPGNTKTLTWPKNL